jgi:hypothetical protein
MGERDRQHADSGRRRGSWTACLKYIEQPDVVLSSLRTERALADRAGLTTNE